MRPLYLLLIAAILLFAFTGCEDLLNQSTKEEAPAAPRQLTVQLNQNGTIEMSWVDGSDNENGFRVEYQVSGSIVWNLISEVSRNTTSYGWNGGEENTSYSFRVYAFNDVDNSDYAYSSSLSIPIFAPTELAASVNGTTIVLTWRDNSHIEETYRIQRKIGTGTFEEIASLGSNTTTHIDEDFPSSAELAYRIMAENGGDFSDASNEVSLTAPAVEYIVAEDDFESYTVGYFIDDPWSWGVTSTDNVVFGILDDNPSPDGGGNNLAIWDYTAADWGYTDLGFFNVDAGRADFDIYIHSNTSYPYFDLGIGISIDQLWETFNDFGPFIQFSSNGKLFATDGNDLVSTWSFPKNQWFHMSIDFDVSEGTYSIIANGNVIYSGLDFYQFKSGTYAAGFSLVCFNDTMLFKAQIDNLEIYHYGQPPTSPILRQSQPKRGPVASLVSR